MASNPSSTAVRARIVICALAIVAAATWYIWPYIAGDSSTVAAVGDERLLAARDDVSFRVRDLGRDFIWVGEASSWCEVAASLDEQRSTLDHTAFVVIGVDTLGSCAGDPVAATLELLERIGVDPVVLVPPGAQSPAGSTRVVLIETLLGPPDTATMPCERWDPCSEGSVTVRDESGLLTDAGSDRLARMIAATIG